jgi:56kDa selenium binding protein (SBP56)
MIRFYNPMRQQAIFQQTPVTQKPYKGDEFHHFGWNACSSALSPLTGHAFLERRYLIIPGLRSSRIYIVDTKPDPTKAKIHKVIEPEEVFKKNRLQSGPSEMGMPRPLMTLSGHEFGVAAELLSEGGFRRIVLVASPSCTWAPFAFSVSNQS